MDHSRLRACSFLFWTSEGMVGGDLIESDSERRGFEREKDWREGKPLVKSEIISEVQGHRRLITALKLLRELRRLVAGRIILNTPLSSTRSMVRRFVVEPRSWASKSRPPTSASIVALSISSISLGTSMSNTRRAKWGY